MDKPGRLAEPHGGVVGIALGKRFSVASTFHRGVPFQLVFAPVPPVGEGVAANAGREFAGPCQLASDVWNAGADGPVAIRLDDGPVVSRMNEIGRASCRERV